MDALPIPLIVLAGGSRRYEQMPEKGKSHHPLAGYKAASLQLNGSPLIEHVCARYRQSGAFDPIYIAGPRDVYQDLDLSGAVIVDTDGNFGDNLRNATEHAASAHPGKKVAYTTADVLPSEEDLRKALDDFESCSPCGFWMLECRSPTRTEDLGSSTWKPKYWIRGDHDTSPVPTLPGHLAIAEPAAVRRHLLYEIFDLAYSTRNTSIGYRFRVITLGVFTSLLKADLRRIRSFQPPTVALELLWNGTIFAIILSRGIDHEVMAKLLRRIYLRREYRRRHPKEKGRVAVLDVLSLARDVDTHEEALELGLEVEAEPARSGKA